MLQNIAEKTRENAARCVIGVVRDLLEQKRDWVSSCKVEVLLEELGI